MAKSAKRPAALTIAGSDSGGGAGIQADLKTFAAIGVHGTSAITCLTAQNPRGVIGIQPASAKIVQQQIEAVFAELPPAAVKTGMLFSTEIIRAVARFFEARSNNSPPSPPPKEERAGVRRRETLKLKSPHPSPLPARAGRGSKHAPPLVLDPVMVATSGARLLKPSAIRALSDELFPLATIITPNLDETAVLLGRKPATAEEMRAAAEALWCRYGCAVLVKGGHLSGSREAVDIFFDGRTELLLTAPFIKGLHLHGTGCTYSAAITAFLARGQSLPTAVANAKEFITQAIAFSYRVARHTALNPGGKL